MVHGNPRTRLSRRSVSSGRRCFNGRLTDRVGRRCALAGHHPVTGPTHTAAGFATANSVPNQSIPAGYTYLLQFIAHDLVDTTVPFWIAADNGIPSRDMRATRLQLDTLYGGGPTGCPIAFKPAGSQSDYRSRQG